LRALAELVRGANAPAASGVAPDVAQLAPVLAGLGARGQEGATRWERFKRWLKELRKGRKDDDEGMLARWSRELSTSEGVARIVGYVGYALLAALALFVIWAELRAAGLFSARRRANARVTPEAQWRRRLMLADVGAAPLAERPGMLLRLLGQAPSRAARSSRRRRTAPNSRRSRWPPTRSAMRTACHRRPISRRRWTGRRYCSLGSRGLERHADA
jgi:hypothetical protein